MIEWHGGGKRDTVVFGDAHDGLVDARGGLVDAPGGLAHGGLGVDALAGLQSVDGPTRGGLGVDARGGLARGGLGGARGGLGLRGGAHGDGAGHGMFWVFLQFFLANFAVISLVYVAST